MERKLSAPMACFQLQKSSAGGHGNVDCLPHECRFSWYWSRKEIEQYSASRKDGIDLKKEGQLRMLYCSFLQDIGMKLRVYVLSLFSSVLHKCI